MFGKLRKMGNFGMQKSKRSWFLVSLIVCSWWSLQLKGTYGQLTHPSEVGALDDIKNSLIDPTGSLYNWGRGDPCTSNWTGVLCYNTSLDDGYLHIKELLLLNMNLSGNISPEVGRLSHLQILDFMWNEFTGTIPKEIGNIKTLQLLLLNGNQLTGTLPEEIGYLPNLDRIQIDQNYISGSIPTSFANLTKARHFHMNNNSLSGPIPSVLSTLPNLVHLLIDNNNLSGYLPPEIALMPNLKILQLDNNQFDGSTIPSSFGNMSRLLKLSLRNCGLTGPIPNLGRMSSLYYLDLSFNQLNGSIPTHKMSDNITTIDLSYNRLIGSIPTSFSSLPHLQKLSLANNSLTGSVPSVIWQRRTLNSSERLFMDFQNNLLSNISGIPVLPPNVTVRLEGNPICLDSNLVQFCKSEDHYVSNILAVGNSSICRPQSCPSPFEYAPPSNSTETCFCAAPLLVGFRLKSPGFSDFLPYMSFFQTYLTQGLSLYLYQLEIDSFAWQEGPRLRMYLKLFPVYVPESGNKFNNSEVLRIRSMFTGWKIPHNDLFGPHELLNFTLLDPYKDVILPSPSSGLSKGALAGIILGAVAASVLASACVSLLIMRFHMKRYRTISKRRHSSKISIKMDGVKGFAYEEMTQATKNFDDSSEVGRGGYGKVYKGILTDGTVVAIKRAEEGSLQGEKEFLTEIELLSRLHHRNLVTLIGYCDEEGEQMLVYEYMPNGTLRDHLSGKFKETLTFALRLRVALGSAKGILYLHTEADPPIFHRDIKATNILLDAKYTAKVADFGLSRLAPVPEIEGTVPTHVSTVVKGTPGYLDPEYFLTHKLTDKSDVYSLGVVFLELLTGMHPIYHGKNIVREVNMQYRSGKIFSIIDERMGSYPSDCVVKFITLALKCCQDETDARPSMAEVVRELESIWHMMPESDTRIAETFSSGSRTAAAPSYTYSLSDISGGDLVSGVMPTIVPR